MATEYKMPQLGLTMTEGTVTKWFKAVGDTVSVGDVLVEVATDKITNQLEANLAGVLLEILVPEGKTALVQAAIAVIGQPGERFEPAGTAAEPLQESAKPATRSMTEPVRGNAAVSDDSARIKVSPYARKLAAAKGIELSVVTGTGPGGRIVERDILGFFTTTPVKSSPLAFKLATEHQVDLTEIKKDSRIMKEDVLAGIRK